MKKGRFSKHKRCYAAFSSFNIELSDGMAHNSYFQCQECHFPCRFFCHSGHEVSSDQPFHLHYWPIGRDINVQRIKRETLDLEGESPFLSVLPSRFSKEGGDEMDQNPQLKLKWRSSLSFIRRIQPYEGQTYVVKHPYEDFSEAPISGFSEEFISNDLR